MKGDLKTAPKRNTLSHLQYVKVHKWCADNLEMLRNMHFVKAAEVATTVFGFPVSQSSIAEMAHDLGIEKRAVPHNAGVQMGAGARNAQAIFACVDELYQMLDIKSERRNDLRRAFGYVEK